MKCVVGIKGVDNSHINNSQDYSYNYWHLRCGIPDLYLILWNLGVPYNLEGKKPAVKCNHKHSHQNILFYLISANNIEDGLHADFVGSLLSCLSLLSPFSDSYIFYLYLILSITETPLAFSGRSITIFSLFLIFLEGSEPFLDFFKTNLIGL